MFHEDINGPTQHIVAEKYLISLIINIFKSVKMTKSARDKPNIKNDCLTIKWF